VASQSSLTLPSKGWQAGLYLVIQPTGTANERHGVIKPRRIAFGGDARLVAPAPRSMSRLFLGRGGCLCGCHLCCMFVAAAPANYNLLVFAMLGGI
jgi:hypothetical protein